MQKPQFKIILKQKQQLRHRLKQLQPPMQLPSHKQTQQNKQPQQLKPKLKQMPLHKPKH